LSRSFQKGRLAIVTDAGRDAVDADSALTNAPEADGEVVWSRRLEVGVKLLESLSSSDGVKKA
jgi:hypothetical protein